MGSGCERIRCCAAAKAAGRISIAGCWLAYVARDSWQRLRVFGGSSLRAHHIKVGQDPSEFRPYAPPLPTQQLPCDSAKAHNLSRLLASPFVFDPVHVRCGSACLCTTNCTDLTCVYLLISDKLSQKCPAALGKIRSQNTIAC